MVFDSITSDCCVRTCGGAENICLGQCVNGIIQCDCRGACYEPYTQCIANACGGDNGGGSTTIQSGVSICFGGSDCHCFGGKIGSLCVMTVVLII